eukprot:2108926-Amphidinium_carterae.3
MITELKHEEARLRVDMPEHNAGVEDSGMMKGMTEGFPLMGHFPSDRMADRIRSERINTQSPSSSQDLI